MIIARSNGGRLCNRMWSYAFLVAHSLKHKEHIFVMDFDEYGYLFDNLSALPQIHFVRKKYIKKLLRLILKIALKVGGVKQFDKNRKTKGFSSVNGWDYRSESQVLREYRAEICKLFLPANSYLKESVNIIENFKQNKILVGVHIRQGDYNEHFNGAYYYENDVYRELMSHVEHHLLNDLEQEVCFLLCSSEKIDTSDFNELDCLQLPNQKSMMEDLYGLSLCNYILGPPSTFSMWSSYIGRVPLYIMKYGNVKPNLENFKIISAVDVFEDNTVFEHIELN